MQPPWITTVLKFAIGANPVSVDDSQKLGSSFLLVQATKKVRAPRRYVRTSRHSSEGALPADFVNTATKTKRVNALGRLLPPLRTDGMIRLTARGSRSGVKTSA